MSREVHQFLRNFIEERQDPQIEGFRKAAIKEYKREVGLFPFNQTTLAVGTFGSQSRSDKSIVKEAESFVDKIIGKIRK